ncbi:MAG: hypothetical protein LUB59_00345 [Candidatus Gastranaerophilales bacterium]|nr:hypothetical protein [Candidatus Gastranaerophilales bacterium]
MDLNILKKTAEYTRSQALKETGSRFHSVPNMARNIQPAADEVVIQAKKSENSAVKSLSFEFNPRTGTQIPLTAAEKKEMIESITSSPEEQKLISKMLDNETVVVTDAVEQQVMKRQFINAKKNNPEIAPETSYIYSPMPKGKIKSYTTSGESFARANGIDKSHIKTDFTEIPDNAVVFMADDCSITGASMVFDLLEHLPENFKGKVIIAPTVIGTGKDLRNNTMADGVLKMFSEINKNGAARKSISDELRVLISDNKTDNLKALDKLTNPENYSNVSIQIAKGSLPAPCFNHTETFQNMTKNEQRLIDALFTSDRINTGYHDSGVMVLLPTKTPNNNVGIMEVVGEKLGLKIKPNGILSFIDNLKLKHDGKRCVMAVLPDSDKKGNSTEMILETYKGGKKTSRIPYSAQSDKPVNFTVKLPDGNITVIKYSAQIEDKSKIATENLFGFEVPEKLKEVSIHKGLYRPKSINGHRCYRTDVLAMPDEAQIISIGGIPIKSII